MKLTYDFSLISGVCEKGRENPITQALVARNYPAPPFKLSVYIFNFNKSFILFHLSFLNLTCSYVLCRSSKGNVCKAEQDCFKMGPRRFEVQLNHW